MSVDLNGYVNKRIEELTARKTELFDSLKAVTKTVEELNGEERKEILEQKMEFYLAWGALAELNELKKVINSK